MINQIICTAAGGNTGIPDCALTLKNAVGGFLVPANFVLSEANLATPEALIAALVAASISDNPLTRIFPLPPFVGVTDNTEDVVMETYGYGQPAPVRDGNYNLVYRYVKGGNCMSNTLRKFNNSNYKFIGIDASGVVYGTKVGATLKGIPLDYFYAAPFKFNDGTATAIFQFMISFRPAFINEGLGFMQVGVAELEEVKGLLNINITLGAARSTNVIKVKALTGCGGVNLYGTYSADLADATNWIVKRNGANIDLTSVAVDANIEGFTITLDATDPDYNVAGPFVVSLAAPSVLAANGIVGYEGLSLTVA